MFFIKQFSCHCLAAADKAATAEPFNINDTKMKSFDRASWPPIPFSPSLLLSLHYFNHSSACTLSSIEDATPFIRTIVKTVSDLISFLSVCHYIILSTYSYISFTISLISLSLCVCQSVSLQLSPTHSTAVPSTVNFFSSYLIGSE